ncbi:MAG: SMP-30/gluconolactonase/LRE family protein [Halomonadaceae bacterium]|nr:MAG: SMP-30/gluconolactonase/LRE family protein [Halomonadaceae bacterium]
MAKRITGVLTGVVLALVIWLLWPSPVDSVAWQPPEPPAMEGPLAANDVLKQAQLLGLGRIKGPEDTAVDSEGRVYGGTDDGWIIRIDREDDVEYWVETGGRPLGMEFDANGNLIVADAWKGLIAINPAGEIEVLSTESEGLPFAFADDLDIASDGRIYFSDASSRFHQPEYQLDMLETRPHGRLLRYDPATGDTETLLSDLYFANGVALSADEDFVLVNETWRYRIQRYWITGERAGESEIFADNMPGFPDNLARDDQGVFWVAQPSKRNALMDRMHPKPWQKNLVAKLPQFLQPGPEPYGLVLAYNSEGELLGSLHDTTGEHLDMITSVKPHNGYLYFGSLYNNRIGRLPLEQARAALSK